MEDRSVLPAFAQKLSKEQLASIRSLQRRQGLSFACAALFEKLISEEEYVDFVSQKLRIPAVDPLHLEISGQVLERVSLDLMRKYNCLPVHVKGKYLFLALADPEDILALDDIKFCTGLEPLVHVASPFAVQKILGELQGSGKGADLDSMLADIDEQDVDLAEDEEPEGDALSLFEEATQAPVVKMVNLIIMESIRKRASDVHIECYEQGFRVRFRIDGVLQDVIKPPVALKDAIISRIKIMAKLNIAEKRLPQDGRIKVRTPEAVDAEFRVSVLPTLFGEKIVMRFLDKSALELDMSALGLEEETLTGVRECICKPHGMFLVTGPTGSGKTTTLYSALLELNQPGVNVMTAEDPVEFSLQGINQVQIQEQIGLTFASALRSFLRQDPDIILVGEIRDTETAQIAVKSALTGHLVLSTLHTNDAPSTVDRLANMGVEPFLLASALNGIMAQRLVRCLCPDCKEPYVPDEHLCQRLGLEPEKIAQGQFCRPVGCAECNNTGYKGRTGLYELMLITPELQDLILQRATSMELAHKALEQGMITMRRSALIKLQKGIISVQELLRVVG